MNEPIPFLWTTRSLRNANSISEYLQRRFTKKEVDRFERILKEFEKTVSLFPELYPSSATVPNLRKAVVHKFTSVFYTFENGEIVVIAMQDNRQEKPNE